MILMFRNSAKSLHSICLEFLAQEVHNLVEMIPMWIICRDMIVCSLLRILSSQESVQNIFLPCC